MNAPELARWVLAAVVVVLVAAIVANAVINLMALR